MRAGILAICVVFGTIVWGPTTAWAATTTIDAPTFATSAKYCASGNYTVNGKLRVLRGDGTLSSVGCSVRLSAGSKFSIERATLHGSSFAVDGDPNSTITFSFSTINVSGALTIFSGATQSGESATVTHSTLQGQRVDVEPSCKADNGSASIKHSTLAAGSGEHVSVIASGSSLSSCSGGSGGKVDVTQSTLKAPAGTIEIDTGAAGKTSVVQSAISTATTIHSDGRCASTHNTPDQRCT